MARSQRKYRSPNEKRPVPAPLPHRSAEEPKTRRFRGWRGWLLRLTLLVLAPVLLLVGLEAALRLCGYGYPTGFFLGPDAQGAYKTNPRFGWRFFGPRLARTPVESTVSTKPPGVTRVFVLGESAAMGTPEPCYNFGRILEVMLRRRYPGRRFEVVNAAITAINSYVIREIARDCAEHQPDLFVVYMGNNEVIGPYGPGTVFQSWSPGLGLIRANIWLRSTRIGQLLGDWSSRFRRDAAAPDRWEGLAMFKDNPVPADDPRMPAVYANFRQNLGDICAIARRAGAGVVVSTVAVNLRDFPPLISRHRGGLSAEELAQWESIYQAAEALAANQRWTDALARFEAAEKIDDRFANLEFRIAECLAESGRMAEAGQRFALARDLDALRFRTDSRLNAIIREVAAARAADGVNLADCEQALAASEAAPGGIPGKELFYEHVHLTFEGNYQLARAMLEPVRHALPALASAEQGPIATRQQCADDLVLTPWDEFRMAKVMLQMTDREPFTAQLDYARRQAEAAAQVAQFEKQAAAPQAVAAAVKSYRAALAATPNDYWLHFYLGGLLDFVGRQDEAEAEFREALRIDPSIEDAHLRLGVLLTRRGELDEASAHLRAVLEIAPGDVAKYGAHAEAHCNLGMALAMQGQIDEAISHYRQALAISPRYSEAYYNLGSALANQGKLDEALAQLHKALEIDPRYAQAHNNLGTVLDFRKEFDAAIAEYRKALEIDPRYAKAHDNLGRTLARRGERDEGIVHLRKAVEIAPDFVDARIHLADALAARGHTGEALAQYREARDRAASRGDKALAQTIEIGIRKCQAGKSTQ
jgi:tetratricopeptide (TPR) repeat protein